MKETPFHGDDARLDQLVRSARPSPSLAPGFETAVWRRIQRLKAAETEAVPTDWFSEWVGWLLRPQMALAVLGLMLVLGGSLGAWQGTLQSHNLARDRYLAVVNPNFNR